MKLDLWGEQFMTETEQFKLMEKYNVSDIKVSDPALKNYINFEERLLVKSYGRNLERFGKTKVNILERLANRLATAGHVGKKHRIITSWSTGKYQRNMKTVLEAMDKIEKKTDENPIQVLVKAIENGSPRDEITVIEQAGARYSQAVDCSPLRRVDLAIRWIIQGSYQKAFGKKKKIADTLAEEIIKASERNMESFSVSKANDAEKQADSAR